MASLESNTVPSVNKQPVAETGTLLRHMSPYPQTCCGGTLTQIESVDLTNMEPSSSSHSRVSVQSFKLDHPGAEYCSDVGILALEYRFGIERPVAWLSVYDTNTSEGEDSCRLRL